MAKNWVCEIKPSFKWRDCKSREGILGVFLTCTEDWDGLSRGRQLLLLPWQMLLIKWRTVSGRAYWLPHRAGTPDFLPMPTSLGPGPETQVWSLDFSPLKSIGIKTNVLCWRNISIFSFFQNLMIYAHYKTLSWKFKYIEDLSMVFFQPELEWPSCFWCPECKCKTFSIASGLVSRNSYEIGPKLVYALRFPGRKRLWLAPCWTSPMDFERWSSKVSFLLFLRWLDCNSSEQLAVW